MTKTEIDIILREARSQDSDFEEPNYKVWYQELDAGPVRLAEERLPLFLARVLVRELKKLGITAHIEVE